MRDPWMRLYQPPPFFLLEVVLLEDGLVFFFLGLLSLEGETGVRLRGDRRKVVTLRPSEDPVKTEATVVLWDKLTVVAVPAVAVPAVAVTAVPAVAVPAVAGPAVAVPDLVVAVRRVRALPRSEWAGDNVGGDSDRSRALAFAFLALLAASRWDRCLRRSIQLSNPNHVVSGQHEQIAQVRDLEHSVCLEHDAWAVHGSRAEGLVVKLPQGTWLQRIWEETDSAPEPTLYSDIVDDNNKRHKNTVHKFIFTEIPVLAYCIKVIQLR